jgi:hypothetical protein
MAKHDPDRDQIVQIPSDEVGQRRSGRLTDTCRVTSDRTGRLTIDGAPWVDWTIRDWIWYYALEELDINGNKNQLLTLLQSNWKLSPNVRFHIADMLERSDLKRKRGRPRVPSYDRSVAERNVIYVIAQVRDLIKGGMKARDAIAKVAKENKMVENTVANACGGRRGSTRRVTRRMPKPTKPPKG